MKESTKALMIMSTMSIIFDMIEKRVVDLSDFEDAVEMIGLDSKEFINLHPFKMIHTLSKKLNEVNMDDDLISRMVDDE